MNLGKKTKIGFVVIALTVIISGVFVMRKKAEEYILKEARIGLKVYFEKYYNGVDSNSIKMKIKYHHHMVSGPYIEGYVNGDKDLWFTCSVIKLPKNEWETVQDELGMVISDNGESGELNEMLKYEYSYANPNHKSPKRPSELISKSEVEKAKKDRDLLNYIPDMRTF